MPFCPHCGELVIDNAVFCSHCGKDLKTALVTPQREGLVEHLKFAVNISVNNPVIFVPEIIGGLILQGIYFGFGELFGSSIFSDLVLSLIHI